MESTALVKELLARRIKDKEERRANHRKPQNNQQQQPAHHNHHATTTNRQGPTTQNQRLCGTLDRDAADAHTAAATAAAAAVRSTNSHLDDSWPRPTPTEPWRLGSDGFAPPAVEADSANEVRNAMWAPPDVPACLPAATTRHSQPASNDERPRTSGVLSASSEASADEGLDMPVELVVGQDGLLFPCRTLSFEGEQAVSCAAVSSPVSSFSDVPPSSDPTGLLYPPSGSTLG